MSNTIWYNRIVKDLGNLPNAIQYYNDEVSTAILESKISGLIEKNAQDLSGTMSYRFGQLQDLEAILKYLNISYDKLRSSHYKKYNERYNRELSDRSIEKYIDGEDDIVDMAFLINEVSLVRNLYLAAIKGLDQKSFQISNIVKLRTVGMEDAAIDR